MRDDGLVLSAIVFLVCVSAAGAQAYRAPRAADGHADLNGIWEPSRVNATVEPSFSFPAPLIEI